MPYAKKADENRFNEKYSRFKLHIIYKNRRPITHYGQERYGSSYLQLLHGHIKQIILDREKGFKDCIERIAICQKLYNDYQVALIYDRRKDIRLPDGSLQKGKEVCKYIGGKLVEWEEVILTESEKRILCDVHVKFDGKNRVLSITPVEVIPPAETIDFKTEVGNAINKPTTPTLKK